MLRPPTLRHVCGMEARDTGRGAETVRGRVYANPLWALCADLDPQEAQLAINDALAPLDDIAAALPSLSVIGWRDAPSFANAIARRLGRGCCNPSRQSIEELAPSEQWAIAKACNGEWPEVLLVIEGDAELLLADTFDTMPGNLDWVPTSPSGGLERIAPAIIATSPRVPLGLLTHNDELAARRISEQLLLEDAISR